MQKITSSLVGSSLHSHLAAESRKKALLGMYQVTKLQSFMVMMGGQIVGGGMGDGGSRFVLLQ